MVLSILPGGAVERLNRPVRLEILKTSPLYVLREKFGDETRKAKNHMKRVRFFVFPFLVNNRSSKNPKERVPVTPKPAKS